MRIYTLQKSLSYPQTHNGEDTTSICPSRLFWLDVEFQRTGRCHISCLLYQSGRPIAEVGSSMRSVITIDQTTGQAAGQTECCGKGAVSTQQAQFTT